VSASPTKSDAANPAMTPQSQPRGRTSQITDAKCKGHKMDKVTRYEWQGSGVILILLCLLGITIPLAVVYFMTHLLRIETEVTDGEKLSEFLRTQK
jgi:hypothetical protein